MESKLFELTLKQMGNIESNLTKKQLDTRMANTSTIKFDKAIYNNEQLRVIFVQDSTYGEPAIYFPGKIGVSGMNSDQYQVIIQFNAKGLGKPKTTWGKKQLVDKQMALGDVKLYSSQPDWYYQGGWEQAEKKDVSLFPFPGPSGKGIWQGKHKQSGGLSDGIFITKHLQQQFDLLPKMKTQIQQKLILQ